MSSKAAEQVDAAATEDTAAVEELTAVLTAERDAARVEAQRERADQRVADLQSAFDAQLHQRQAEITQAREELHVYQERAIRAEALGPASKRRS